MNDLATFIHSRGYTTTTLAQKMGMHPTRLQNLVEVLQNPEALGAVFSKDLIELADVLECSMDRLCGRKMPTSSVNLLSLADAEQVYEATTMPGVALPWAQLPVESRQHVHKLLNAARRYEPLTFADRLRAAVKLLGDAHPDAVGILQKVIDDNEQQ